MFIGCIDQLGSEIDEAWRASDYGASIFPDLAAEVLSRGRLSDELSPDDVVRWVFAGHELPQQPDPSAKFGQPPITVFRGRRFHIDALFWVDGTTAVHQHSFSGAFQVLAGSSIETRYLFDCTRNVDGRFILGTLQVDSTSFLRQGDIRTIKSGHHLIHSLFHLERPSVTLVVRTYNDADAGPQFDYARPGIGHDPFFSDLTRDRMLQLVAMLRTTEHREFERLVGDLVSGSDLHTSYRILRDCSNLPDRELVDRLVSRVRDAGVQGQFRQAFLEMRRLAFLQTRRSLVKDPDLRFLLGVLLNAHRRTDVLDLVRGREGSGDPSVKVAGWLRRLSQVTLKLQAAGTSWEPNLLGLPEFTDDLEVALALFLGGKNPDGARFAPFLAKLRALPSLAGLFA